MLRKIKYPLITAAITATMLVILYISSLSGETFLISDAYDQYSALLLRLRSILLGDDSLLYSFNGGLGSSFIGTFFYYLSSPFNLLLFFIKDIDVFLIVATFLKLVLASITAYLFFNYHFKKENKIFTIIFSVMYVFISYNMRYFFNIMWMDAIYLLPLLLLGIDRIIDKKEKMLFVTSLVMFIFTNYYLGYMACIFTVIYFNYRIINAHTIKEIFNMNMKFILTIGTSLLLTSFVLIPVISYIPDYARAVSMSNPNLTFDLNPLDFLKLFFIGPAAETSMINKDSFYLYTGLITIPLTIFYFMNNAFTRKEKLLSLSVIILLFISVACNFVNYMWHGFAAPQFFNGRFTFFFSLILLFISYKSLIKIENIKKKDYVVPLILVFLIILLCREVYITINIIFTVLLLICLLLINNKKLFMPIILFSVIIVELLFNAIIDTSTLYFAKKDEFERDRLSHEPALNYINKRDKDIFRVETNVNKPFNGPIMYKYNGIDLFLSTVETSTANIFTDIGYTSGSTKNNTISYYSGYEVIDSLLGIKYHIAVDEEDMSENYILLEKFDDVSLYQNPYALSLGFMSSSNILNVKKEDHALAYQNNIFKSFSNKALDIYEPIEINTLEEWYSFTNTSNKDIFIYTKQDLVPYYVFFDIYIENVEGPKIKDLDIVRFKNDFDIGKELFVSYNELNEETFEGIFAAYYNHDNFEEIISDIQTNQLTIDIFKGHYIKGSITATNDKNILVLTIPYDSNWSVAVNGKKVTPIMLLDGLMGVELDVGTHTIELKYQPKELYIGLLTSTLTALLILLFKLKRRYHS